MHQQTPRRERRKVQRLTLRDISCSPDDRFIRRYVEDGWPEDQAILDAYEPRLVIAVRIERTERH